MAKNITPSVAKLLTNLIERQNNIAIGKIVPKSGQLVGVNLYANLDTQDSVPYLTHQDFSKSIKELTDFCDYAVINICHDKTSSGIKQYYYNDQALDKLLKNAAQTRNRELGRLAAYEFEQVSNDVGDYTTSVARYYSRNSIVSTLKPMMLFVEIRLDDILSIKGDKQYLAEARVQVFLKDLAQKC